MLCQKEKQYELLEKHSRNRNYEKHFRNNREFRII
jgi:hypothetical protein